MENGELMNTPNRIRLERKDPCLERLTIVWRWEELAYQLACPPSRWCYFPKESSPGLWVVLHIRDAAIISCTRDGKGEIVD